MGKSQRDKGGRGEREIATMFRDMGYDARRNRQSSEFNNDADVTAVSTAPPMVLQIEVKRVKRFPSKWIKDAFAQAEDAANKNGGTPLLAVREDNGEGLAILKMSDFMNYMRMIRTLCEYERDRCLNPSTGPGDILRLPFYDTNLDF